MSDLGSVWSAVGRDGSSSSREGDYRTTILRRCGTSGRFLISGPKGERGDRYYCTSMCNSCLCAQSVHISCGRPIADSSTQNQSYWRQIHFQSRPSCTRHISSCDLYSTEDAHFQC